MIFFSCQMNQKSVGISNWSDDGKVYKWHLGTENAVDVAINVDKAMQSRDYTLLRNFLSDTVTITASNGVSYDLESFINILTSGEMIWQTIKKKYSKLDEEIKCYHIFDNSKEDGLFFREGLNLSFVDKIEEADFILACTPFSNMQPIDYVPMLDKAVDKK